MGFIKFVMVGCAVALFATACTRAGHVSEEQNPTRIFFSRNCAVCHGAEGEGKKIGNITAPPLRAGRALTDTDERITQQITEGGGGMPPFKYTLTDDQIQALVRFIRQAIQEGKAGKRLQFKNIGAGPAPTRSGSRPS